MSKNMKYFKCTVFAVLAFTITSVVCQNDTENGFTNSEITTPGTLSSTETPKNISKYFFHNESL